MATAAPTGALWRMDHGSDFRGDHLPPEGLNQIQDGGHHGWPICHADRRTVPAVLLAQGKPDARR